jgi:hypothetical protein
MAHAQELQREVTWNCCNTFAVRGLNGTSTIVYCAAGSGSIEMIEWLRQQHGMQIDAEVLSWAAGAGKTAMCQHLRSAGCDWDIHACESANADGHLDTLRWLERMGVHGLSTMCVWLQLLMGVSLSCICHKAR